MQVIDLTLLHSFTGQCSALWEAALHGGCSPIMCTMMDYLHIEQEFRKLPIQYMILQKGDQQEEY